MITIQQFRPILIGADYEGLYIWQKINWSWVLQRIPMLLFALVSSYGVGHLLHISDIPFPFDYLGAISFDIGFLGAISLADMQLKKTRSSSIAYIALNVAMSALAALFNVLSHAGGKYANIDAEAITVGAPFAIIGLCFAFYYHSIMSAYINQEIEQKEENDKALQLTKEKCRYCGEGKPSLNAIYGHYRSCEMKAMHGRNPDPSVCKCLLCHPKV
jgi:hypothetical protein